MAEATDQLIFRARLALHGKKIADAKKYVEQALKQVSDEKNDYMSCYSSSKKHEKKEKIIAHGYALCADIFFQVGVLGKIVLVLIANDRIDCVYLTSDLIY